MIYGVINNVGYISICLDGEMWLAHRLIWLYEHGYFPEFIDHKDGNRLNNRLGNLRSVTRTENNRNLTIRHDNKSGFTGVSWYKNYSKWRICIGHQGKNINLGYRDSLEDAIALRQEANIKYGYHKNHGKKRK